MGVKERREREGNARLDAILAAAETVFARDGYQQARMEDIAATAELAKGTLYYYFKSKDEIFGRLLERESGKVLDEIRRRIPETLDLPRGPRADRPLLPRVLRSQPRLPEDGPARACAGSSASATPKSSADRRKGFDAHAEFVRELLPDEDQAGAPAVQGRRPAGLPEDPAARHRHGDARRPPGRGPYGGPLLSRSGPNASWRIDHDETPSFLCWS